MSEKTELAASISANGFNCAQAVFAAFAEDYDIDAETAMKIAATFGGGMRSGEVCGAATGALMAIGAAKGHYIQGDTGAKADSGARTVQFMREFRERNGGCLLCRELLGIDTSTPEGREIFVRDQTYKTKCKGFIETAVAILEEQGY
ncbi:MAG: C-GCAxxG-C-C family protein [Oscillospiraceae bacterium]|jgi:C_GCAxxG_C_C family probable redox protein|nr:C-GCAxxG-C-C family protein [Oscillospiraceae bacterium]